MTTKFFFASVRRALLPAFCVPLLVCVQAYAVDAPYSPLDREYRVNSRPNPGSSAGESNGAPAVARDPIGNFVVTWHRYRSGVTNIYGRRYSAAGAPQSLEFRIDSGAESASYYSGVGMDGVGNFTVVWSGAPGDGYGNRILARQFDFLGVPKGPFSVLELDHTGGSSSPQIAMRESGDFVVVWEKVDPTSRYHVYGQRFNAAGQAQAPVFEINFSSERTPLRPIVAINESGAFVVVWAGTSLVEADSRDVYAQRYDADGQPVGDVIQLATISADVQEAPDVALQADGQFLVTWTTWAREPGVPDIVFQRFAADGSKLGAETQVNHSDWGNQRDSSVSMDADGRFVISWSSNGEPKGIFARWYDASGSPETDETLVSTSGFGGEPAGTSVDADGDLVFAWTDVKQEGSEIYQNIVGRRYSGPEDVDLVAVLTAVADKVSPNADIALELSVLNGHDADLNAAVGASTGVSVKLSFPSEAPLQSITGENWTCGATASTSVTCNLAAVLDADEVAPKLQAILKAPASDKKITPRIALIGANQFDSNASNQLDQVTVNVVSGDTVPEAFAFASQMAVARDVAVISNAVTITGIDTPSPIKVDNGHYSINGGGWTKVSGTVPSGASVRLRHQSSGTASTSVTTTLSVGGVTGAFTSTTASDDADITPDVFAFADRQNVQPSTTVVWPAFTVTGINAGALVEIGEGGSYRVNQGDWGKQASTVHAGDQVQVRQVAASTKATSRTGTLRIGTASATFTSVTIPADATPEPFDFTDQSNATRMAVITSNTITISGINTAAPISVSGADASYSINGAAFTTSPGNVNNGAQVRLRMTSSSLPMTKTTVSVSIGGVNDSWAVTTGSLN
ncbi:MAG: hypothetical protein Q8Q73_03575 [Stagnimonas sp.]|nr:hypothetical protein [Stagnimonas sp.]